MLVPEGFLHRVQIAVGGQAFDGEDIAAVGLDGEHRARLHRLAVEGDGACAADGSLAADVGAGEADHFGGSVGSFCNPRIWGQSIRAFGTGAWVMENGEPNAALY